MEQQIAWGALNVALGMLATAYHINDNELNESVGSYAEEIVSAMVDGACHDSRVSHG
ncbi:hypothetical protein [Pseudonocardia charpentierae]|uniref:Tetracyclin repressor-like C-terminal domain-containing protein n=1 Tax=Pseudonocardia charpentierae TaxID=3075545 RepID=A0ABU2NLY3_9PSEU|nr:hypothetical protein [Pseudonocardia sp. DSM 45834]MDT0354053.1 hypothetical protein [Pseudonocardia sp. DSM 45834]